MNEDALNFQSLKRKEQAWYKFDMSDGELW